MSYIYLASPYSHPDPKVREYRFNCVNEAAASLMREGVVVYSPISHSHPIALNHDLPTGWGFWGRMDEVFIKHCASILILQLEGWDTSIGVRAEGELARKYEKNICFMEYPSMLRGAFPFPTTRKIEL